MNSGGPTIVVDFGESVAESDRQFIIELDEVMNVDDQGEVKTEFYKDDFIWFRTHYNHSKLQVTAIKTTAGQVVDQGQVSRSKTDEMLFVNNDTPVSVNYEIDGSPSAVWYCNEASLTKTEGGLKASNSPCIGDITYSFSCTLYQFRPPPLSTSDFQKVADSRDIELDEAQYPIAIVFTVEAV